MIDWLFEKGYRNVLIEICNETHFPGSYDQNILFPGNIHELIEMVKKREEHGYRYLVGTSFGGMKIPTSNVVIASDFLLIHGNGAKEPTMIDSLITETRNVEGYRTMPVVINEDDHYDFDQEINNFSVAIEYYVSWGYFDFRFPGETDYREGFQSVPVDWGVNSDRKKAFFNKVAEITGTL